MSTRPATTSTRSRPSSAAARTRARRRELLRRRLLLVAGFAAVAIAVTSLVHPVDHAVEEIKLPLRHEDIIRQQAADKHVDPALIAAVIYTESHFRDQTSHAGATGLMQLMPATADYIADKSGGTRFERADLATPQINIAYGTWYLRYLLTKYKGNTILTLAAYNAGEGKVDQWRRVAAARGERFRVAAHIPFQETRDYVHRVLAARADYRRSDPRELGL
jgi:soluble lytic murein transglycosylase